MVTIIPLRLLEPSMYSLSLRSERNRPLPVQLDGIILLEYAMSATLRCLNNSASRLDLTSVRLCRSKSRSKKQGRVL